MSTNFQIMRAGLWSTSLPSPFPLKFLQRNPPRSRISPLIHTWMDGGFTDLWRRLDVLHCEGRKKGCENLTCAAGFLAPWYTCLKPVKITTMFSEMALSLDFNS